MVPSSWYLGAVLGYTSAARISGSYSNVGDSWFGAVAAVPLLVNEDRLPGDHLITPGAANETRRARQFSRPWCTRGAPARYALPGVCIIPFDPVRLYHHQRVPRIYCRYELCGSKVLRALRAIGGRCFWVALACGDRNIASHLMLLATGHKIFLIFY